MEDDRLITSLNAETDGLLENHKEKECAKLIIKITIKPYHLTLYNIHLG